MEPVTIDNPSQLAGLLKPWRISPRTLRFTRRLFGFYLLKEHSRLLEQRPQLPALLKSFARVEAMLQRVRARGARQYPSGAGELAAVARAAPMGLAVTIEQKKG